MKLPRRLLPAAFAAACSPLKLLNAVEPGGARRQTGIAYGSDPRQKLDVYQPQLSGPHPLCVFLYGGGWRSGSRGEYRFVGEALAARNIVCVIPDYRLSPEAVFPVFVQDCARAVAWAIANAGMIDARERPVVSGHSAGAYNAVMLAMDPYYLAQAGASRASLRGVVALAGPYDFVPEDENLGDVFPNPPREDMPMRLPAAGSPKMLLLQGAADDTVKPHNAPRLAAKLRAAGVAADSTLYPGVGHVGLVLALGQTFRGRAPVLEDVARFVRDT